jgi:hypothetical protein
MATNPFAAFISGEALTAQPQMSYLAMLGDQTPGATGRSDPRMAQSEMFGSPFGTSPASRRYFQGQFQNIYDEFLGKQGRALQGGQMPTQNFQQFLQAFPFTQRYSSLPPEMTGRTLGSFAPRVQYSYL